MTKVEKEKLQKLLVELLMLDRKVRAAQFAHGYARASWRTETEEEQEEARVASDAARDEHLKVVQQIADLIGPRGWHDVLFALPECK